MSTDLVRTNGAPPMAPATVSVMTPDGYKAAMGLAQTLVDSGFLPRSITKPAQALAIILAGQEYGLPPMQSLRQIAIVEGKPTLSAELMLSLFKRRGGRAAWKESTEKRAVLWLRHPNGDEHTEVFTIEDATRANLAHKDNWKKYPKAMLRARCASAGIRAMGEADGAYTPEELGSEPAAADLVDAEVEEGPKASARPATNGSSTTPVDTAAPAGMETWSPSAEPAASGDAEPASSTDEPDTYAYESELPAPGEHRDDVECWHWHVISGTKKAGTLKGEWRSSGLKPQRSLAQNAKMHALRGELGITEEQWHAKMRQFNKVSSAELAVDEAAQVIDGLEKLKAKRGDDPDLSKRKGARAEQAKQEIGDYIEGRTVGEEG